MLVSFIRPPKVLTANIAMTNRQMARRKRTVKAFDMDRRILFSWNATLGNFPSSFPENRSIVNYSFAG